MAALPLARSRIPPATQANQNSKQELARSAGKHAAGGKRGKISLRLVRVTTGFCFAWLLIGQKSRLHLIG